MVESELRLRLKRAWGTGRKESVECRCSRWGAGPAGWASPSTWRIVETERQALLNIESVWFELEGTLKIM